MHRTPTGENLGNGREQVLHTLLEVLERDNSLSRCRAVKALERLDPRDDESSTRLIGLLRDPDPDVRMDCAAALGRLRAAAAAAPLVDSLRNDPEGDVRVQAAIALSIIKSENAVEPLIECLKAGGYPDLDIVVDDMEYRASWEIQSQALNALGEIADPRAAGPVIELMQDEEFEDLQESGFRVLAQLSGEKAGAFLLGQLKQGDRLARRRAARALSEIPKFRAADGQLPPGLRDGLTNALLDADPTVRVYAARALGGSRAAAAVVPLTLLLSDPDGTVRSEAASVLARMRGREVADRLHRLLDEPDSTARRRIVQVLGEIGDPASHRPLCRLLETEDDDLLYEVVQALGKIGLAGPEDKLAEILATRKTHSAVRIQAARALGRILGNAVPAAHRDGPPPDEAGSQQGKRLREVEREKLDPERVLANAAFDEDEGVRLAALTSLVEMSSAKAVATLVGLLRGDSQPEEEETEGEPGQPGPRPDRDRGSGGDEAAETRARASTGNAAETSTLASILAGRGENAAEAAEQARSPRRGPSRDPARLLAARLLGGIPAPGPRAVEALIEAAESGAYELRKEALAALGRIGDAKALPVALEGLEAEQREVRLAALDALGGLGRASTATQERLDKLLGDPDPYVRQRAIQTLAPMPGSRTAQHLRRALDDVDQGVCRAALGVLSEETYSKALSQRIVNLMFEFSGELREDAAAALRKVKDYTGTSVLLATLEDMGQEERHWICIDALAEMYARRPAAGG